ncbi:putative late blight resistance proteinR1B-16 [Sesamum alatum]|uniref:Late blight resistance proteinR1B-16 n=1 Tax=Sesamum alatum TaxID=300844 RepID=A0AAE1YWY5_9LAMI|nr:putative late blight resistance proteinR1B-16 [Sesamum alatum]
MAYAALVSLMHNLEDGRYPAQCPTILNRDLIESLREKFGVLQEFLQDYSQRSSKEIESLEREIRQAAYEAEDIIESVVVKSTVERGTSSAHFCQDIQGVIEKLDSIKKDVIKVKENEDMKDQGPESSSAAAPSRSVNSGNDTMVGSEEELIQLMDELTGHDPTRRILAIVGMGGIGKTTLAKNIYDNSFITEHFQIRAWVTVSQEYNVREIILRLLHDITVSIGQNMQESRKNLVAFIDGMSRMSDYQLGEQLYKSLWGRRYLIVLDDLWSIDAWMEIKTFFPDNSNGSRILVTTRLSNVAEQCGSCNIFRMSFLDADESWELFCRHVFGEEDNCPSELEEIGKRIVKKCKGLPLAIIVVGGLLSKSDKTQEYWEQIAADITAVINCDNNDYCLSVLHLSYSHLPVHLKPCFLYMGVFPEDSYISISKLIKLWVAEGFLKPIKDKSLEEVAEEYLEDLIYRNLILPWRVGFDGDLKGCRMHDLLRDLCLREAQKQNFFSVTRIYSHLNVPATESDRRLIIHQHPRENEYSPKDNNVLRSAPLTRSLVCSVKCFPSQLTSKFRLLRVLNTVDELSVADILQLVNSRYLAFRINTNLHAAVPSSISQLRHLQTLIVESSTSTPVLLPTEIWEMPQLRHLKFSSVCLPDPPVSQSSRQDSCVLENLQTLSYVINLRCTEEVVRRIPNLKKLRLFCEDASTYGAEWSYYCLNNLVHLQKLESLMLTCVANAKISPGELDFPHSLKKLILLSCRFSWEDMTIIGSLPNLEVLILQKDAFDGEKWEPNEGEFPQLQFLLISSANLEYWHAESTHFPKLENLVLYGCLKLKEIPSDIGEIPTLESISLCLCSSSAVASAKEILMEQRSLGNDDFRVSVNEWMSINKRLGLCPSLYTAPAGVAVRKRAGTTREAEVQNLPEDPPKPWDVEVGSSQIFYALTHLLSFERQYRWL